MKMFKRAAAFCAAVVMSLSVSATVYAVGNGGDRTLVVTGDTLDNKNVYAVQMFDARVEGETEDYTFDSYVLADDDWIPFFTSGTGEGGIGLTDQDSDDDVDTDDVRAYLEKLSDESTDIKTLADKAQAWVRKNSGNFTVLTATASDDRATFTDLKAGYYLVYPEGGSAGNGNRGTDAMLVNVPRDNNAVLNIKSTYPTVDKKVDTDNEGAGAAADNSSAQVGDIVTFTLNSKVPDMSDYTTFYFGFTDTLSNGLKIVDSTGAAVQDGDDRTIDNLTVTIGGETAVGYTVSLHSNVLKVEFSDLKSVTVADETEDAGKEIVVTYKAMITEGAVTNNPALNTVKVEYSNDPTTSTKGESTTDESKVYTYEIDVNKWATDAGGKIENLAGAKFVLSTSKTLTSGESDPSVIKLVGSGENYRVAKPDEDDAVTSFTTTAVGDVTIAGLEGSAAPGTTYYLHEIEAPAGYNKLKAPITIVIELTNAETGDATITVNGSPANGSDGTVVDVENKKGIELPETGSIGTIGLTVAGVAIVLLGVFAPRKKKKNDQE